MPTKEHTFTGRFTTSLNEFEYLRANVGTGFVKIIFHDEMIKIVKIEQWMIDHAEARYTKDNEEYMIVTHSKYVYQRDRINAKKFGGK